MQENKQEKSPIKKRILQYLDFKGVSQYEFYKNTGITRGILTQNNGISEENISRILAFFGEISPNWLITGEGEMLKSSSKILPNTPTVESPVTTDQSPVPCKLCIEKDQRIADLQKSVEMWEANFKSLNSSFQSVIQSQLSDKQYLHEVIDNLQQQHFDDEQDATSQAG